MVHQSRLMKRIDLLVILWSVGLKPLGRIVLLEPDSCFITTKCLKLRFAELSFFTITQVAFLRRKKAESPEPSDQAILQCGGFNIFMISFLRQAGYAQSRSCDNSLYRQKRFCETGRSQILQGFCHRTASHREFIRSVDRLADCDLQSAFPADVQVEICG